MRLHGWQEFVRRFPHARVLWDTRDGIGGTLRAYSMNGRVVIIHDYQNDNGWTAYVDPFTTLNIDETFVAIAIHVSDNSNR